MSISSARFRVGTMTHLTPKNLETTEEVDETLAFPQDADARLMLRVAAGEQAPLRELIVKWQSPLMNFFYRSLRNHSSAEDLTQQTFVRIYRAAQHYEARAKFSTYLFQIARRLLINEYRRQKRRPIEVVDPFEMQAPAPSEDTTRLNELEATFARVLENLPENQKTALLLLKQQSLSYEEIAEVMDASVSAVKTWIHRGRLALKKELSKA